MFETIYEYQKGRMKVRKLGFTIKAIVLDGRPGVRNLFSDIPVQMCHFHQKQITRRYLTSNPKLEAGIELKAIVDTLTYATEDEFSFYKKSIGVISQQRFNTPTSRNQSIL